MTTTHESQLAALLDRAPAEAVREPMARKAIGRAVRELVGALRNHHTGTAEHSNRLASQCRLVGEHLDLARPLNARERAVVRSHTIRGAEILAEIAGLAHLAPLVRSSHERWDGTGYPDRLAGPRIPLAARVVFTVDSYDAMTNDRPYRRALAREEARRRIAAASGSAFDPHVVRALLAAFF